MRIMVHRHHKGPYSTFNWCVCAKLIIMFRFQCISCLLLAHQVPGLFEGDEFTTLMTQCKEGSQRDGLMLDSAEELYKWFTQKVERRDWEYLPLPLLYMCVLYGCIYLHALLTFCVSWGWVVFYFLLPLGSAWLLSWCRNGVADGCFCTLCPHFSK